MNPNITNAAAPAAEATPGAARTAMPSSFAAEITARPRLGWLIVAGWLRRAFHLWLSFVAFVIAPGYYVLRIFGYTEYDAQPLYCPDCQDAHGDEEVCPRQLVGDCDVCQRVVMLDRYLNCPDGTYHRVMNRRPYTARKLRVVHGVLGVAFALFTTSVLADPPHPFCPPPSVEGYTYCADGSCAELSGQYVAYPFGSLTEAATRLLALEPAQQVSAQLITLTRSQTWVLVWRATPAEQAEYQASYPVEIVVLAIRGPKDGLPDPRLLINNFQYEFAFGYDAALVSTNDPDARYIVVTRHSAPCPATERIGPLLTLPTP